MSKPPAYRIQVTFTDGRTETSPRFAFRSIAASGAVTLRKRPDVASATVIEA